VSSAWRKRHTQLAGQVCRDTGYREHLTYLSSIRPDTATTDNKPVAVPLPRSLFALRCSLISQLIGGRRARWEQATFTASEHGRRAVNCQRSRRCYRCVWMSSRRASLAASFCLATAITSSKPPPVQLLMGGDRLGARVVGVLLLWRPIQARFTWQTLPSHHPPPHHAAARR
jgi:hypothetical protein